MGSKTKINHLDNIRVFGRKHKILGFDISVTYVMLVNIVNAFKDLSENLFAIFLFQGLSGLETLEKGFTA